ncbi:MAG: transpeptidase family protein [Flavobacteriales bacterium]|nr:transpeptidase family protein [Flavobacteriales bacterium]
MKKKESLIRLYSVYFLVLFMGLGIVVQIFYLQIFKGEQLKSDANKQIFISKKVLAPRGNIYASNEQKTSLALSVPRYKVFVDLITIREQDFTDNISDLSDSLSVLIDRKTSNEWKLELENQRLDSNRYFFIARGLRNDQIERLRKFPIFNLGKYRGGCIIIKSNQRVKPYGMLANRTVGYAVENDGKKSILVGIEGAFNEYLKGQNGQMLMEKIRGNEWKPVDDELSIEPVPGSDVYTSIDVNIQDVAESALLKQLREQKAQKGCAVLMEVKTGFVKAIANLSFDPKTETYFEAQNHAVGLASEPGSTFKLASLLVALEQGKVEITDSVDMTGRYEFYDNYLTDGGKIYGRNTIKDAFEKSSNVISQIIYDNYKKEPQEFIDGLKEIGIHQKLGLSILGEGVPLIKESSDPTFTGITLPWMSIGYELKMTPLQTLALYNAVANEGTLLQPQFVKCIKKGSEIQKEYKPRILNASICSKATLRDLKVMLEGVVERGTAKNIKARGFSIAGKTGTSKIAQGSKGYGNKYQASFCGYFPSKDPVYSCIVVVQGPTKNIFGSVVSGTVFKEIADKVYAQEFQKENIVLKDTLNRYPYSRSGDKMSFLVASENMRIPVEDLSNKSNEWISTRTGKDAIKIIHKKMQKGLVPNVVGMGLIDATYMLEKYGLFVQPVGSGIVREQSIKAGLRINKGQKIILQLG